MPGFSISRRIAAPRERVFKVFTDFANADQNIRGISRLELLTGETIGVGTRFRETREMFGKEAVEELEITAFEAPSRYVVEAESHGCHYVTTFELADQGSSTDLTMSFEGHAQTLFSKLMTPLAWLMRDATRKIIEADLDDLQKICEAG